MEILDANAPENSPEHLTQTVSKKIDCCAGISILPTAYPFFRGYQLAEQLCDSAKSEMRRLNAEKNKDEEKIYPSSWLDFVILHGEQSPTLKQIRETDSQGALGSLHFAPYRIANEDATHKSERRKNIENLLSAVAQFSEMPHGKIKELRGVLARGEDDIRRFKAQFEHQKQKFPVVPDWEDYLKENLFSGEKIPQTPYVDAIELTDFYDWRAAEKWLNLK